MPLDLPRALALAAAGRRSPEIAAELGATPEAVRQALRRAGVRRPAGRPPGPAKAGPVSHHSKRGRALLATLAEYARRDGIEPEEWLEEAAHAQAYLSVGDGPEPADPTAPPPADDEPPEPCLDCERVTCACGDVGDLETRLDRALGRHLTGNGGRRPDDK